VFEIISSRLKIYEGAVLVGMLRSHGLAAQMWYQHTAALEGELTFGGVSVMVPTEEMDEAFQLIVAPVELGDEWIISESDAPELYAAKYPDICSLLLFFVKWTAAIGFVFCFAAPVLSAIAGLRGRVVELSELISAFGQGTLGLVATAAIGAMIAVLGAIAFALFRQMDRSRTVCTIVAAFFLFVYNPLVSVVALVDLVLTGWDED
jgi:hypothetical protein